MCFRLNDDVLITEIDDDFVVMKRNDADQSVFSFNNSGTKIMRCLLDGLDLDEIIVEIAKEYNIPNDVSAADVKNYLSVLKKKGIIIER